MAWGDPLHLFIFFYHKTNSQNKFLIITVNQRKAFGTAFLTQNRSFSIMLTGVLFQVLYPSPGPALSPKGPHAFCSFTTLPVPALLLVSFLISDAIG